MRALVLPPAFALLLVLYLFLTTAYSTYLKRKLLIDVICLAALYASVSWRAARRRTWSFLPG